MKRIVMITGIIILLYCGYSFFIKQVDSPRFVLINNTSKQIQFSKLTLRANTNDYSYEELKPAKYTYVIDTNDSSVEYIDSIYWNNSSPVDISFGFSYKNLAFNQSELKGVIVSDLKQHSEQKAYCQFIIHILPNKTTITQNNDFACSRPMYLWNE